MRGLVAAVVVGGLVAGMSAAARLNPLMPSAARVRLAQDGSLTVRMAMTDIGTGTYTILAQIAGEMMGLPVERIRVEIGRAHV